MGKNSLLFVFFFVLIIFPIVLACDDINYSVSYLGKDDNGCFTGLTFSFYKKNCNVSCFNDFDLITFKTNTDYFKSFNVTNYSAQISNPFIVVINSLNCSNNKPTYDFYANLYGEQNCSFSFRLEEEYQTYLTKLAEQEARLAEEKRLLQEAERQRLLLEEQKQKELERLNQIQTPSLPRINNSNNTILPDSIMINAEANKIDGTMIQNENQQTQTNQKDADSSLIVIIIGLIALIILTATLIIYLIKKPKKKILKKKK